MGGLDNELPEQDMNELVALYRHRFTEADLTRKQKIWRVLCRDFFRSTSA